MTKADIVGRVQQKLGFHRNECFDLVEAVLSVMKKTLESGENLKINGFGTFQVKRKTSRRGRNPQTGETIVLDARQVVTFKPSTVLRAAINGEK